MALGDRAKCRSKTKRRKQTPHTEPLAQIYRKGLGAFNTGGSRPGQSPESWAMAFELCSDWRKARQVDAKQWKQIQAHRKRNRK